jgi:hypothetical protein
MKKSVNGTLILFGVFAALLGWYLIFEQKVRPERNKKSEEAKNLVQVERESLQELEIDRKKAGNPVAYETYRLKKSGTDWNIVAPVEDEADSSTVGTLIATLTSTQSERTVEENPKDLTPFGLKDPQVKIRARKDSSSPWTEVRIGADTAVGFNAYVQVGDKPAVHTANRNLKTTFDKDLSSLRNKKLFKVARADIDSLEVQNTKESFVLSKSEGDNWVLARTGLPADSGEVNKTLNSLIDAKAKDFADDTGKDTAKFGLARPAATLTVTHGRDKKKLTVLIGKAGEKYYLKHSEKPAIFEIDKDLWDRALKAASDYRNLNIAKFNRFTITKIRVEHKSDPVELVKADNDWKVPGDTAFQVDGAQVDSLLTHLQDAKATDFVPIKSVANELKSPALVIRLFEKEGDKEIEKQTFTFARRFNQVIVTRTGLDMGMLTKPDTLVQLNVGKSSFAKKPEEKKTEKKSDEKKTG